MAIKFDRKTFLKRAVTKIVSRPAIGGLAVSSSALQYTVFNDGATLFKSVKIPPQVVMGGRIGDEGLLKEALLKLKKEIDPTRRVHMLPVVLSVPSSAVFVQSFRVPISHKSESETVMLNLQMISPLDAAHAYFGYSKLKSDDTGTEYLGAVAEKKLIDDYQRVLEESGFYVMAVEFPAVSMARLVRADSSVQDSIILFVHVSTDGIEISLLKEKLLYFAYFHSWGSIQGEGNEIKMSDFGFMLSEQVRRVMTFCFSKFRASISRVLCVAPGVEEDVTRILKETFSLEAEIYDPAIGVSSLWLVPAGAAYRGTHFKQDSPEISVAGAFSEGLYYKEQLIEFLRFWRNVIALVAGVLITAYIGVYVFFSRTEDAYKTRLSGFNVGGYSERLTVLEKEASNFNAIVAGIKAVKAMEEPLFAVYTGFKDVADKMGVRFGSFQILELRSLVTINAVTARYSDVTAFKNSLESDARFQDVQVPLSSIVSRSDGYVGFTVMFRPRAELFYPEFSGGQ